MSATQAEYMAASEAAMEAVWIRKFVGDLGVMPSIKLHINMYCDNSAAIIFANDSGVMKGARHFLRRYHYVREQVESGEIKILKVHTDDNLADPFTKALPRVAGTYDYLYKPCPDEPPANAAENVKAAWKAEYKIHSDVACLMLGRMSPCNNSYF
ncbi:hypothetical protein Tco_1296057 [Tanacetum coccineum]